MVTRTSRDVFPRRGPLAFAAAAFLTLAVAAACDKMPLLAPSGTVITLFPTATTVPTNGQIEIIATVIEQGVTAAPPTTGTPGTGTPGTPTTPTTPTSTSSSGAGTPVQNGTLVSFTTTIGRIEPREARTQNGEVRVKFFADGQSGTAVITAYSGGASGKLENLKVGSAAAERLILTASPQTLAPSGGTSVISARVEDTSGLGLAGVPVNFIADTGQLSASSAVTDQSGIASVTLTTARPAKVTANVAGKTAEVTVALNPRTGITISGPTAPVPALTPASFTVNVGTAANVRDVTVNFGDGRSQSLGALSGSTTVPHIYADEGNYIVTATAIEASGFQESVSTGVSVLPAQPPNVIVRAAPTNPARNDEVIVTATVSGNTSTIVRYEWNFGSDATPSTAVTSGNQAVVSWSTQGTKLIRVRAIQATGPPGDGFGTVNVSQ